MFLSWMFGDVFTCWCWHHRRWEEELCDEMDDGRQHPEWTEQEREYYEPDPQYVWQLAVQDDAFFQFVGDEQGQDEMEQSAEEHEAGSRERPIVVY